MDKYNQYHAMGFKDRSDYLNSLVTEYDIPIKDIQCLATILGSNEDFDGLIVSLEDYEYTKGELTWI